MTDRTAFLLQAIPWTLLLVLWALVAAASLLLVVLPLSIVSWACRALTQAIGVLIGAALALLMAVRPKLPPQDPTATAPTTEGAR